MKLFDRALGGVALLVLLAAPAWAQETIACPGPLATCPLLRTVMAGYTNALAPLASFADNTVYVTGAMAPQPTYVLGGFNDASADPVSGNTVTLDGNFSVGRAEGGYSNFAGGSATGNTVEVLGGASVSGIYGGHTYGTGASATGNTVRIVDSVARGPSNIFGGYNQNSPNGNATGNTVIIGGAADLGVDLFDFVAGGNGCLGGTGDCFSGNTLRLENYTGTGVVKQVQEFQNYEFVVSADSKPLNVSRNLTFGSTRFAASTVTSVALAPGFKPATGTKIPLICVVGVGARAGSISNDGAILTSGNYDLELSLESDCLYVTASAPVPPSGAAPHIPTLSETALALLALLLAAGALYQKRSCQRTQGNDFR